MPLFYKAPYKAPKPNVKKRSQPLEQPQWDDTIHDLSQLKLSPDQQLQRRLQRISKNQWGLLALAQRRAQNKGQESARYTPSAGSNAGADRSDDEDSSSALARRDMTHSVHDSGLDSNSDDDMCRWNQPQHSSPAQGASSHQPVHEHRQQQQQRPAAKVGEGGQLIVDAGVMQLLLDKIDALEGQLLMLLQEQDQPQQQQAPGSQAGQQQLEAELLRQLASSQEQLAATQEQLAALEKEHQSFVAHSSSLLTRLQAQMQQLLGQAPGIMFESAGTAAGCHAAAQPSLSSQSRQPVSGLAAYAAALGPVPLPGYVRGSASSPAKPSSVLLAHAPATTTGSPSKHRPAAAAACHTHAKVAGRDAGGRASDTGGNSGAAAAAAVLDEARLPSYAEMRQRQSLRASGGIADTAAAPGGAASSSAGVDVPGTAGNGASVGTFRLFDRDVPPPMPADNAAAAVAAGLSGVAAAAAVRAGEAAGPGAGPSSSSSRWSNAAQVQAVFDEAWPGRLSALSPALDIENQLMPGLADVDRGLGQGLPRAAVGRVFSAAGCVEVAEEAPRPRVVLEQLKGNMSLRDHVRAAAEASGGGGVMWAQGGRM